MGHKNKPLFDLDQPGLQAEVDSYKPGNGLIWPVLFPLKYTPKFDLKGIEGEDGIPVSADRVAFNTKAPLKSRKTVGSWSGQLSKISMSKEKTELEIGEYEDLKTIAAANTEDKQTARYLVDMVYDDVKACNDGADYKIEIDACRLGSRGIQTFPKEIEGDMATEDVINFNVPKENFVASAIPWGQSGADGLGDLAKWQDMIASQGKKKPMFAFLEKATFELLLSQEKTMKRVASVLLNVTGLVSSEVLSLDNINAYQNKHGYPRIIVLDSYATIEHKDGSRTTIKPWNKNVVALSPVAQLGWTYYKPVPFVKGTAAIQAQGKYAKTTVYSQVNPLLEVTMIEAYVQPALINRGSLVFANIANTEWADGQSTDEMSLEDRRSIAVPASAPANSSGADNTVNVFDSTFDKETVLAAMKSIGATTNPNITAANLESKIEALDEEQKVALKKALGIEA